MRSLFLRIFLWFWLAMAVVVAVMVVSSPLWTRVRPAVAEWEQKMFAGMVEEAQQLAEEIEAKGVESAERGMRRGHGGPHGRSHLFLLDSDLEDPSGRPVPEEVADLARRVASSGETQTSRAGFHFLLGRQVQSADGRQYTMVLSRGGGPGAPWHRPPRPIEVLHPSTLVPRLLVIVLLVGGLCYWLSRYLTSPLRRLRVATRDLAAGDLSVRVGAPVASRGDEIGDLARDFDTMAGRVETLVEAQKRLLRDVSHELRSPLARLGVALELARTRSGQDAAEPLERISVEADRLNRLIERLLTLTRLEGGDAAEPFTEIDLVALVGEVVADAAFEASASGVEVRLAAGENCAVDGSPALLRSAVENVIRNAVQHTGEGTVVEVEVSADGDRAVVKVRDRGPGVPPEDVGRLFEPFYRVDEARGRSTGGAGLGLAITASAIRLHRGTAIARNRPEGGLEVDLTLPLARSGHAPD